MREKGSCPFSKSENLFLIKADWQVRNDLIRLRLGAQEAPQWSLEGTFLSQTLINLVPFLQQ